MKNTESSLDMGTSCKYSHTKTAHKSDKTSSDKLISTSHELISE